MRHLLLLLVCSGAFAAQHQSMVLEDPPMYPNNVYNRSNALQQIENALTRFDSTPGVAPAGMREIFRDRTWVFFNVNADYHYLNAQPQLGVEALISVADELHLKWQVQAPSNYVAVLGMASSLLLDMSIKDSSATAKAAQYGEEVLTRLPVVPLDRAASGAAYLLKNHSFGPEKPAVVALDLLPRAEGLSGVLAVVARMNDFMQSFSPGAELAKLPEEIRRVVQSHAIPEPEHGEFLDPKDLALYLDFVAKLDTHRLFAERPSGFPERMNAGQLGKFETALASYIQRRYTLRPADLKELQLLLDRHIKDPVLKERITVAAFKGTNPFAGRTPAATATAQGQDQANGAVAASGTPQDAAAQSRRKSPVPSGPNQLPAAESTPLAATSGVSAGSTTLWLALAGAAALLVAVLRRALARGRRHAGS